MASTVAETIKKLSLTSFTIERQTDAYSNEIISPVYEECIAAHLRKLGYPDIFSWNIGLQKRPIKEIGYYTVKVSLSNYPKDQGEIKLWVVPTSNETKEKPKPSGFPKYYIQPKGSSIRKFYRVDREWSTGLGSNAVWLDAKGVEYPCAIYLSDYKILEEVSKEKAMSLIPLSSDFPYYLIPTYAGSMFAYWRIDSKSGGVGFCYDGTTEKCSYIKPDSMGTGKLVSKEEAEALLIKKPSDFPKYLIPKYSSVVAYHRMDSKRSGISIWKNGSVTKLDWEPDSDLVREATAQEVVGLVASKSPTVPHSGAVPSAPKKGISIKEAVRQLEAEGKAYSTYDRGRLPLFSNTNAVRVIMGAYKKSTHCRRVSLKEALRWAKNL